MGRSLPPPSAIAPGGGRKNGWGGAGGRSRPQAAPRGKPVAAQNPRQARGSAEPQASPWQRRVPGQGRGSAEPFGVRMQNSQLPTFNAQ